MNKYTLVLNQYTNMGKIQQQIVIVAKNEEEAWRELHDGTYKFKDAELVKEVSMK